jgi:hypothetical protein
MKSLVPFLLFVPLCAVFAGCEMPSESRPSLENMTPGEELAVPGPEVLWVITLKELQDAGYRLLEEGTIESTGDFETRWQEFPSPFRFEGRRVKILGRVEEVEGRPGYSRVRMAAWVQRNADMKDPMNTAGAIWQDIEPDSGIVETLLYRIDTHFM